MTSSGTAVVTLPADTQILITREFDAPKHLVYRAYTTPELIERWWSGDRGEVTSVEVDLRVGGRSRRSPRWSSATRARSATSSGQGMEGGLQEAMDRLEEVAAALR